MKDYIIRWDFQEGGPISSQVIRVELTREQHRGVVKLLEELLDSGDVVNFFVEEIPQEAATFRELIELAREPMHSIMHTRLRV